MRAHAVLHARAHASSPAARRRRRRRRRRAVVDRPTQRQRSRFIIYFSAFSAAFPELKEPLKKWTSKQPLDSLHCNETGDGETSVCFLRLRTNKPLLPLLWHMTDQPRTLLSSRLHKRALPDSNHERIERAPSFHECAQVRAIYKTDKSNPRTTKSKERRRRFETENFSPLRRRRRRRRNGKTLLRIPSLKMMIS